MSYARHVRTAGLTALAALILIVFLRGGRLCPAAPASATGWVRPGPAGLAHHHHQL